MRNHQHGHIAVVDEVLHQLQHLRLNGYIQCGGRFVGNQQLGTAGQRDSNNYTLLHTAGELMRIVVGSCLGNTNKLQHILSLFQRLLRSKVLVQLQTFGNLLAYGHNRVQRSHRVLENHCHVVTAHFLQLTLAHFEYVFAFELNRTAFDNSRRIRNKVHDRQCGSSFARTGFAYQAQSTFFADSDVNAVDSMYIAVFCFVMDHKVLNI